MRLTCPGCGTIGSIEAFTVDEHAKRALVAVTRLPGDIPLQVLGYLALFRPGADRGLTWKRVEKLVEELCTLTRCGTVQWRGKVARPAPASVWVEALKRIADRPPKQLPLKSHGYLTSIAYDLADEADRSAEYARNRQERSGGLRTGRAHMAEPAPIEPMSREQIREIREAAMGKKAASAEPAANRQPAGYTPPANRQERLQELRKQADSIIETEGVTDGSKG